MQTTVKKATEKKTEKSKEEIVKKIIEDEKTKKSGYGISTPRTFMQKTSTVDIYGLKKVGDKAQSARAPKKVGTTHTSNNTTPMKDFLRSSPSSISQISTKSDRKAKIGAKTEAKLMDSAKKIRAKELSNVTVNSPPARRKNMATDAKFNSPLVRRKLNMNDSKNSSPNTKHSASSTDLKKQISKEVTRKLERGDSKEIESDRQRTKTRTLDVKEIKVLKPDTIDNNSEMQNLSKRLNAKPKTFYVDLDGDNKADVVDPRTNNKSSDEDVSYEDDFESYESDFDSYHSEDTNKTSSDGEASRLEENSGENENCGNEEKNNQSETSTKDGKDEEKMLDSGSFDLREQRSATRKPVFMENILEDTEGKRPSLTDEGFQDMSTGSTSAVSSMKTHAETVERPLFVNFTKSKEIKRKKKINEKLKQRAKDVLSMITLHEMSYMLFEMKPIPYDLFMATFGRSNYTQTAVQTFDDGITEEIQTEEILFDHKWTQHPIEFSKYDIYLYPNVKSQKYTQKEEDYLTKFSFLTNKSENNDAQGRIGLDEDYTQNPLRIYLEQKNGAGSCEMLPYESYKSKINGGNFDAAKLNKFLKKIERKVSNILSFNKGEAKLTNLVKNSRLPFSKGYVSLSTKFFSDNEYSFLKESKISHLEFSKTKHNLLLSIHKKSSNYPPEKCVICLWDISVARLEPIKILIAVDNVVIGRFKGNTDGVFVAALEDGSIHLWDMSEKPIWRDCVVNEENSANLVDVRSDTKTQTEIDREWNLKNCNIGTEKPPLKNVLQACAFTNSAANMMNGDVIDDVVGLEFVGDSAKVSSGGGRKVVGQFCSLQRIGVITIWSIVQEKKTEDPGKAYWSKLKLEKSQAINLVDHIDTRFFSKSDDLFDFNLSAAKRRISSRKSLRNTLKRQLSRPKSSSSSNFDISRPNSAAMSTKVLPAEKELAGNWDNGIVCYDLKIMKVDKVDNYLVAKNCGEVYCCTRIAGAVKVNRFCISSDSSSITCLEVSPHHMAYFLAATDTGTINLCSFLESRVLLTLDCRNGPPSDGIDRCQSDHKGRFVSSAKVRSPVHKIDQKLDPKLEISSLLWSHCNPCRISTVLKHGTLVVWDLTQSDINSKCIVPKLGTVWASTGETLTFVTGDGELQIHKLSNEHKNNQFLDLFQKYVALL